MINNNGTLVSEDTIILNKNRGFLYGDAVFETLKVINGTKILFLEDHYFRLMASMRIVRMEIPLNFTLEYIEAQIINLLEIKKLKNTSRVRITVYRNYGGLYTPTDNSVSFIIDADILENQEYIFSNKSYIVDLYTDFYIPKQLLSSIKTTNKILNVTASIYAKENSLDNCIFLNENKNVVEALQGNIFLLKDNTLKTPSIMEGCLNGIMRKKVLEVSKKINAINLEETTISSFELQMADELFITNVIKGIQPITRYRKKEFKSDFSSLLIKKLNEILFN